LEWPTISTFGTLYTLRHLAQHAQIGPMTFERVSMQRSFVNVLSNNVGNAAKFYEDLLGMKRHFDSNWFVILTHSDVAGLEFGILQRDHDVVPEVARTDSGGVIMTFVMEDCDVIHAKAKAMGADVVSVPTDMPYGQRRMLVRELDGTMLDISAPTVFCIQP
jgi:predicted enzyme related to lactoylglutathione lyase